MPDVPGEHARRAHLATLTPADPERAPVHRARRRATAARRATAGRSGTALFVRRVFKLAVIGRPAPVEAREARTRRQPARPAVPGAVPPDKANLRWHDLRDTCASLLIHNGASILLVSKRLGHASTTTTMDRYAKLYPSTEAAMAGALDAIYDDGNVVLLDRRQEVAQGA